MIVCFGSVNLDLIFRLPSLPLPGQTILGRDLATEPGGKGANQAVAAARDGARVIFAGAVGRDGFATDALALLEASGVDLARLARADASTGAASICVDPAGRNLIAVAAGANALARAGQVEDSLLGLATVVLVQNETDPAETATLIRRARARGARVVLNLAPAGPMAPDALRAVDVLVLNEDEAAWVASVSSCAATAAALHTALGVDVVVTLGGDGLEAATSSGAFCLPARPVKVIDTTAAGDCFTGVLAAALDRGMDLRAALIRANAAAGVCCTKRGTQSSLPWAAETDAAC